MNLAAGAPFWLVALLCVALVAAAVEDVLRLKISNVTVVAVIATALIGMGTLGFTPSVWENFAVFGGLLVVGTFLFSSGIMGGGDIKLFAAVGLWVDLQHAALLIATVLIAGGLLAVAFLVPRLAARRSNGGPWRDRKKDVPYAVAIAMGAFFFVALQHQASARDSNPLEFHPLEPAPNSQA